MTSEKYDTWHAQLAASEYASGIEFATGTWYDMVRIRLGPLVGPRVLEVGCGRGAFAIELALRGASTTAVDFSPAAIEIARERAARANAAVEFHVADARNTGLPSGAFDLVISCECLEHVPSPHLMAQELFRLCRPGGRCLLTTPSYMNGFLIGWARAWILGIPYNSGAGVQPHENFFLSFRVRSMLKRAGFIVVEEDARIFQLALLPRVDPAKLRVVQFRRAWANRLARPFGLHFLFDMQRPDLSVRA